MVSLSMQCTTVSDAFREVFDLVRRDSCRFDSFDSDSRFKYYFRGLNKNFEDPGSCCPPCTRPVPSLNRDDNYIKNEHIIFNESIRLYPQDFPSGETTFERLTRMEHFEIPTRLLDVTSRLATALGMTVFPGANDKDDDILDMCGVVRVFRVKESRIKYSTSDTVVALSNLARIAPDHVTIDNLRYLAYECQNERAGFYWEEGSDVSNMLKRDIKKVWCVRPVNNNVRIQAQRGEFFIFGCGDKKKPLNVTFSEADYGNPHAPSEGIAEIGILTVTPELKHELKEMAEILDVTEDRLYPDFGRFHKVIKKRFGGK